MTPREERGQQIVELDGQIRREHDTLYLVRSQTIGHKRYVVQLIDGVWACDCPDHQYRHSCCKHTHSVEISRKMRDAVAETVTIKQVDPTKCKFCESPNIIKKGIKKLKKGSFQNFKCDNCGGTSYRISALRGSGQPQNR